MTEKSSYIALSFIFLCACAEETVTVSVSDIIDPIEEMKVDAPVGSSDDPYPEEYTLLSNDEGDYAWGHLRGYLHSDMSTVWTAIQDPLVYVNHRAVVEYSVEELDSDLYDYVYQVYNLAENIVDVEFDTQWRHAALEGSTEAPQRIGIRWEKTGGTEFISMMKGSIQILSLADGSKNIVEIQVVEHMTATLDQEENTVQYLEDLYERWALMVHGEDIPVYEH